MLQISYNTTPKLHTSLEVEYFMKFSACKKGNYEFICEKLTLWISQHTSGAVHLMGIFFALDM